MEPMPSATDHDRRDELLEMLAYFVQLGIDRNVRQIDEWIMERSSGLATRVLKNKMGEISHLRSEAFPKTMTMLYSYATETLEQVAASFTEIKGEYDCIHMWVGYNDKEWNTVAGENRDAMFRDMLVLRRYGWSQAWNRVHALLDTYRALNLNPGSIHLMTADEIHSSVAPVFKTACSSRSVLWLRMGPLTKRLDSEGNYVPPVEPEVPHEYRLMHLSREAVEYVAGSRERHLSLREYMMKRRETLYELDFDLFLLWQEVHSSVSDGVL